MTIQVLGSDAVHFTITSDTEAVAVYDHAMITETVVNHGAVFVMARGTSSDYPWFPLPYYDYTRAPVGLSYDYEVGRVRLVATADDRHPLLSFVHRTISHWQFKVIVIEPGNLP